MKLQFRHQGRQFFFVTLTLEGRPQALSRLVDGATAPELAADRLLILSGFTNTPHISPLAMRRAPTASHLFRQNCLTLNDQAAALCAKAQTRG